MDDLERRVDRVLVPDPDGVFEPGGDLVNDGLDVGVLDRIPEDEPVRVLAIVFVEVDEPVTVFDDV